MAGEGRWRVVVAKPRPGAGERFLRLRARRRRADGRYEERVRSVGTDDRVLAERARVELERAMNEGALWHERDPTVLAVLDSRIAMLERIGSPKTTIANHRSARAALEAPLAELGLRDSNLTRAAVLRARDELVLSGRRASVVNLYLGLAGTAWRRAHERDLVRTPWPTLRSLEARPTEKRPFTDSEVSAILAWASRLEDRRWLPIFALLASVGARSASEVLLLRGRDVDRAAGTIEFRKTKTRAPRVVPVPSEVLDLVPDAEADAFVFPGRLRGKPIGKTTPRKRLREAILEIGIPDMERLDVHSLRRAWVATSQRAGVPRPVAMRVTGHASVKVFEGYQRNAIGDDLRAAVEAVHEARARAGLALPTASPSTPDEAAPAPAAAGGAPSAATCGCSGSGELPRLAGERVARDPDGEVRCDPARDPEGSRLPVLGRSPHVTTLSRWASADPDAMRALLVDVELRAALLEAIEDLGDFGRTGPGDDRIAAGHDVC